MDGFDFISNRMNPQNTKIKNKAIQRN